MADLFADIIGQKMAVSILRSALEQGASHAYLFHGPPGVGKSEAAMAFAAGLLCPDGGCAGCIQCQRVLDGVHPDVEVVAPEGSVIPIDDIVKIGYRAAYKPYEARAKAYVFPEAEKFHGPSANAFLKTLEEPPQHVFFLLVADRIERLQPTIVSRCQLVAFAPVPQSVLAADLLERCGLAEAEAELIARVSGGNLTHARELATSESARRQRDGLLDLARDLPRLGLLDTEIALDELMATVESRAVERVSELDAELARALEWAADARTKAWLKKRHDERVKRQQRRLTTGGLQLATRTLAGWYRDLALVSSGAEDGARNQDRLEWLRETASPAKTLAYSQAVEAANKAQERLRYNVDARSAIADMFRSIKEALN